ncbi:hypothetical protein [Botrimarina mediterranea]|uniref:hypothetical protein n=1 Tax=Botrimarina mediterranea TaxID=2528022 RepID=UPI001189A620|nr:hypothetical protein K2D_11780 [Planctomycetes bacterium K2D]
MAGNNKGGGIKQLAIQHVEKVVAVILVGAAGYLVYSSLSVQGLGKTPNELAAQADQAQQSWRDFPLTEVSSEDFKKALPVTSPNLNVPSAAYIEPVKEGLNRSVVPPVVDRTDPKLLPATDLEGGAVTAIFAFESKEEAEKRIREERAREQREKLEQEAARERNEGELLGGGRGGRGGGFDDAGEPTVDEKGRKIRPIPGGAVQEGVVTGGYERFQASSVAYVLAKAPVLDQAKIYEEALRDSKGYNPALDVPQYAGVIVERAEVTGDEDAELKWEQVQFGDVSGTKPRRPYLSERYLLETTADWLPWQEQIVDGRYVHPILTMPLPPLVQQNWSPDVVHSDAPLQAETDAKAATASATDPGVNEPLPEIREGDSGFGRVGGTAGPGGEFGGRGGRQPTPRGFGGRGEFGGGGEFGGRGGRGEFGGGAYAGRGGGRGPGAMGDFTIDPDVPFAMVRIFDFGVQPGRQYRYRVKLVLSDVNDISPSTGRPDIAGALSSEVTARVQGSRNPYLQTEWSEPSSIISVPMAGDALVEGAKLPSGKSLPSEGTVDLLVQSYALDDDRRAIKAGVEESFRIGSVLNLVENTEVVSADGQNLVEMKSFKFRTGLTLCDFQGGEELPGKKTAPVKALFMDAAGRLFVHDQLDDRTAVQNYKNLFDENAANAGGGFMPRGGGGRGGRGEFR